MTTCSVNAKTQIDSYDVVPLPEIPHLTTVYLQDRNAGVPGTSWRVRGRLLCRYEGLFKDQKNATGDVVAPGIGFVEEWEKYTARAKKVIITAR